ncbi:alpha-copaene synthase-like [Lolium perenne]|uniref:alpha-copaene synthase-like n=1 Tax=Lolium perenne TaxID=4522 RepID=UPI003A99D6CA
MASGVATTPEFTYEPSPWIDFFAAHEQLPLQQINMVLRQILESEISNSNLHEVSLRFRLLREQGHWVSPDVFNKFRSEDGSFIRDIMNDPKGLLSLYNATHLLVHGEKTLEEAMDFSRHHLKLMSGSLKFPLDKQVQRALCIPLPRTNKRVEMMHYILEYEQEDHTLILLELAKHDFNLQQHVHLKELKAITRWDHSAVSILPKYLKKFYMEILRTFQNVEVEMPININYDIAHLKRAVQNNVMGYLHEAEWSHQNHKPSFVDHVKLTSLNIGVPAICVSMMTCMNDQMMKPALEWAASVPDVIIAVGKISRFMNDIGAFVRRKCKGDLPSTVERYISEHCVTSEVAITRIDTLMEEEWRTLNQDRFKNHALLPALQQFISLAISTIFFYGNRNDVYTHKTHIGCTIESLFIKPI